MEYCLKIEDEKTLEYLEQIRCVAGVMMGLGETVNEIREKRPATPKVCIVGKSCRDHIVSSGELIKHNWVQIVARIISMGKLHHAFTATGAIAIAAAAGV